MAEGYGRGAAGSRSEPPAGGFVQLEQSLVRTIDALAGASTPEARALLIEARRLRSIVANWHSIPPELGAHTEMVDRVLHLSTAAGTAQPRGPDTTYPHVEANEIADDEANVLREHVWQSEHDGRYQWSEPTSIAHPRPYRTDPPRSEPPRGRSEPPPRNNGGAAASWTNVVITPNSPARADEAAAARAFVIEAESVDQPAARSRDGSAAPRGAQGAARAHLLVPDAEIVTEPTVSDDSPTRARPSPIHHAEALVTMTALAEPFDPRLTLLADPVSVRADVYRSLSRKLAGGQSARVVAVTSPEAGEGKTSFAANIALALREGTRGRVLLVEANLRTPGLATMFGFKPPVCFEAQLAARKTDPLMPWSVVEQLSPLHVLAVDPSIPHGPMFDPEAFASGMTSLKSVGYDFIVVDTPQVLGGAAVNLVADQVDGIVLVVTGRKSTRRALKRAHDQLAPARILGVVLME